MAIKEDFDNLIDKLKTERDEISLKLHLASMEAKEEFEGAEEQWHLVKIKAAEIADDSVETSEEFIAKAKIVGDELKETYQRIAKRITE
jgi:CRISPR/Cas system CMR-associated protein Cmr3 (group 5 of RAMP superfamily)